MQLLCDQMLAELGRWLRAAGYDTEIAEPKAADREILERALRDKRLLLTRDRHFTEMKAPEGTIIFLKSNSLDECALELGKKLKLDWLYLPFSRCLICNSLLTNPDERTIAEQVPPDICSSSQQFRYCHSCNKVYWEGSHTDRMLQQLQRWQERS